MRFERTELFKRDYKRLSSEERKLFDDALRKFSAALKSRDERMTLRLPQALRVKSVKGARGIYELTWSFAGPDGRATFEYVKEAEERVLRLRRVGGHEVFREP